VKLMGKLRVTDARAGGCHYSRQYSNNTLYTRLLPSRNTHNA
jgi:hypothetical protein